ncbi:hypothetical protein GCM10007377_15790 [Galliscardovia ingluviei]|uniref:Uncharacterized protein n=1 Tax=Galliscardovia ingluviei TaxID=1769422 RepID=A0A8J3ARR4_9BIFI|nr:hypothetical protein [Galliscardovia ingluviei]GGI15416.1 hypothetical protein GCM10007377_15790 [Galliscardovia ingluviei]
METTMISTMLNAVQDTLNCEAERLLRPYVSDDYEITAEFYGDEFYSIDSIKITVIHRDDNGVRDVTLIADAERNYLINSANVTYFRHGYGNRKGWKNPKTTLEHIAPRIREALRWLEAGDTEQASAYLAGLTHSTYTN